MLQTANVLKSNFTRPIGCCVLAVKCSKNDHLNLEECTRQLTRMMGLMPSDFAAVNSSLPACAMIPNQQNFTRHDERFNSRTANSGKFTSLSRAIKCSDIHLEVLSVQNRKYFEYFLCFHRTLGISPKDSEGFKADIAFHLHGTRLLADDLNFDLTFVTQNFIGSYVVRYAF